MRLAGMTDSRDLWARDASTAFLRFRPDTDYFGVLRFQSRLAARHIDGPCTTSTQTQRPPRYGSGALCLEQLPFCVFGLALTFQRFAPPRLVLVARHTDYQRSPADAQQHI